MKYLQTSICLHVIIRMQQEASARNGNHKLRAAAFLSDDQPLAAKKTTEPFDIRFPNLPPPIVEVRPRIQVEWPCYYQVPPPSPPPKTCRNILRVMSIQKNFENDQRKEKAKTVDAEIKKKQKVVAQERTRLRRQSSRQQAAIASPVRYGYERGAVFAITK